MANLPRILHSITKDQGRTLQQKQCSGEFRTVRLTDLIICCQTQKLLDRVMERTFTEEYLKHKLKPCKDGQHSPGCHIHPKLITIIRCCLPKRQTTWVQAPRGRRRSHSTYTTPSYSLGEFVLPVLTTLGSMCIEVLAPRKEMLPPEAQDSCINFRSTAAPQLLKAPHIKRRVGRQRKASPSSAPPSSLKSDARTIFQSTRNNGCHANYLEMDFIRPLLLGFHVLT